MKRTTRREPISPQGQLGKIRWQTGLQPGIYEWMQLDKTRTLAREELQANTTRTAAVSTELVKACTKPVWSASEYALRNTLSVLLVMELYDESTPADQSFMKQCIDDFKRSVEID